MITDIVPDFKSDSSFYCYNTTELKLRWTGTWRAVTLPSGAWERDVDLAGETTRVKYLHRNLWNSMEFRGVSMGYPWSSMEYSWSSMECHVVPRSSM